MGNQRILVLGLFLAGTVLSGSAQGRTVYRCVKDGVPSLANQPEPGSRCTAKHYQDGPDAAGASLMVGKTGTLYRLESNGQVILTTRALPGAKKVLTYTIRNAPADSPAHTGLASSAQVGRPQLDAYPSQFREAARRHQVDEAWLRAVAHVESAFRPTAESPKGAQGIMQLMPATAARYNVNNPFDATQSINAGARHLAYLLRRYQGNTSLAAAAYNAGEGAVARYNGIPPYRETQAYVARVEALKAKYAQALR